MGHLTWASRRSAQEQMLSIVFHHEQDYFAFTCLTHRAPPEIIPDPDEAELSLDMSETSSESNAESLSGLSIVAVECVDVVEILLA